MERNINSKDLLEYIETLNVKKHEETNTDDYRKLSQKDRIRKLIEVGGYIDCINDILDFI